MNLLNTLIPLIIKWVSAVVKTIANKIFAVFDIRYCNQWVQWKFACSEKGVNIEKPRHIDSGVVVSTRAEGTDFGGLVQIRKGCTLSRGAILAPYGGRITISENVFIGPYCLLYGHGGLTIGANCLIAGHTIIIPANHVFSANDLPIQKQGETRKGIVIEDDCWIGSGAQICDGVVIGKGTIVGAGSVVTKSLPPGVVAAGVPARQIRLRQPSK